MVKIPHGNMSPEDLLRMTKKTCPCYTKVFKYNHGMVKIPHGNMSPEDLLRMTCKKTCPCYTKVFKYNHGMVKIPHGNMSPGDLLRMIKKTCPCYTKVFKFRGRSQRTYACMRDHVSPKGDKVSRDGGSIAPLIYF